MARQERCTGTTKRGVRCRSFAVADGLCVAHHPAYRERRAAGSRRGGLGKASARRAAKQLAAVGGTIAPGDLPSLLRGALVAVCRGELEPSQAQAIAALAKTSVSITNDVELEARIEALESAAGLAPAPIRRVK